MASAGRGGRLRSTIYWARRDDLCAARGIGVAILISGVLWGCGALLVYFLWDHPLLLTLTTGVGGKADCLAEHPVHQCHTSGIF